jgi:hypothetical protein
MKKLTFRFKGGSGSGHYGHQGRPGKRGGSIAGSGGSQSVSTDEVNQVASSYISKMRKVDKGSKFTNNERDALVAAGFNKVSDADAYVRASKNTPFDASFSMVTVHMKKDGDRAYVATHFNKDGDRWGDSSESGYTRLFPFYGMRGESGVRGIINSVNAYQNEG